MYFIFRWVMLTIGWFLSASLKWGQEAIDSQSQWFHFVAWGVPAIMTIVVQIIQKVSIDGIRVYYGNKTTFSGCPSPFLVLMC